MDGHVRTALRIALAHHPACGYFPDDVFRIGRVEVCRGCTLLVPVYLVTLFLLPTSFPPLPMAAAAIVLGLPQAATYLRRPGPPVRAAAKLLGGVSLAAWTLALSQWRTDPLLFLGLGTATAIGFFALQYQRWRTIRARCDACPWKRDWDRCPGFNPHPS